MWARTTGGALAVFASYVLLVRPRMMQWGATRAEVEEPFPGAEVVPHGVRGATMAVTIDASPEQVWPWLVQLGGDRAGWYSWDHLDNAGRASARRVHAEWQDLEVGDQIKYWTRRQGPVDAWDVVILEENHLLGLRGLRDLRGRKLDPEQPRPEWYTEGLWAFLLKPLPDERTRLVIGGYQATGPIWLGRLIDFWIYPTVVWIMQARMLAVLKRNIESTQRVTSVR